MRGAQLLERFDLTAKRHLLAEELSRSENREARLVAAVLPEPALLVLDEPFGSIDRLQALEFAALLKELAGRGGAVLLAANHVRLTEAVCDRLTVLADGVVAGHGSAGALRRGFAPAEVRVQMAGGWRSLPGVRQVVPDGDDLRLVLDVGVGPQDILRNLVWLRVPVLRFECATMDLEWAVEQLGVHRSVSKAGRHLLLLRRAGQAAWVDTSTR